MLTRVSPDLSQRERLTQNRKKTIVKGRFVTPRGALDMAAGAEPQFLVWYIASPLDHKGWA
jgi:hypothetical protein